MFELGHSAPQRYKALHIHNLTSDEYEKLLLDKATASTLESTKVKLEFNDNELIIKCAATETHESGLIGWNSFTSLLSSRMQMPLPFRNLITWSKGEVITKLPALGTSKDSKFRIKSPDCSLGPENERILTLVLETGFSESASQLIRDAKTWLWRPLPNGGEGKDLEAPGTQCVILLNIDSEIETWLQAAMAKVPIDSKAAGTNAITISIWRNEVDSITGNFKVFGGNSLKNRAGTTTPICISTHKITRQELMTTYLERYLAAKQRSSIDPGFSGTYIKHSVDPLAPSSIPLSPNSVPTDQPIGRSVPFNKSINLSYFTIYLDDLLSPSSIPVRMRERFWVNIPIDIWVWGVFRSYGIGAMEGGSEGNKEADGAKIDDIWEDWVKENQENIAAQPDAQPLTEGNVLKRDNAQQSQDLEESPSTVRGVLQPRRESLTQAMPALKRRKMVS